MILTILIPTYNRLEQLIKNILMLSGFIRKNNLNDDVMILVSDNCSPDNIYNKVQHFINENTDIKIVLFKQEKNTGPEKNALFTLKKAETDYVMYLGDDDYIREKYLIKVIEILKDETGMTCILPNFQGINPKTGEVNNERDKGIKSRIYEPSFKSCFENSWRGHQLSGIVLRRDNLYKEYNKRSVHNIYPFIFFVAYSSLKGRLLHLTDYPVKVSEVPQNQKDWSYKDDGLITEIFQNYKCLYNQNKDILKRTLLELKLLKVHNWRYLMYLERGKITFMRTIIKIIFSKNTSILTKIIFPILILPLFFRKIPRLIFRLFKERN